MLAPIRYFAYGSNMMTARLQLRCASAVPCFVASAEGWRLAYSKKSIDGSGKATLVRDEGWKAFGVVFEMSASELPELDRVEGAGSGYDRENRFPVRSLGTGRVEEVVTYIATADAIDVSLNPYDWYHELVLAGARQHRLPPDYINGIEARRSVADPMPERPTRREAIMLFGGVGD